MEEEEKKEQKHYATGSPSAPMLLPLLAFVGHSMPMYESSSA